MPRRLLCCLLLLATLACAVVSAAGLDVRGALQTYNAYADVALPIPAGDDLERLAAGEMVDLRERITMQQVDGEAQDRIRVVGYQIVHRPRLLVWLGALDISTAHTSRLAEHLIDHDAHGGSVWYQHLDTPWPVRDRHWVIRNTKSTALTSASRNLVWEHRWRLADDGREMARQLLARDAVAGLRPRHAAKSIYLDVNRGAWTMFALDDNTTLVAVHTAASMGGWIPDAWIATFVRRQLGDVLRNLTARADVVHERYTGSYIVFDGAGNAITPQMAAIERARYAGRMQQ